MSKTPVDAQGRIHDMPRQVAARESETSLRRPAILLALFAVVWTALAIAPWYRQDWLLENLVVFAALPLFVLTARRRRFSDAAYALLFLFLCLHEIGAHYTYSQVPYDEAFRHLTGRSLNELFGFRRNHYDRVVHFLYGLLLLPLSVELFDAAAPPRGVWRFLLPVLFIESHSACFELIEWAAAVVFGGDLGQAYLGTQGDAWDAQWDMLLALLGALLAQTALFAVRRRRR
jgi:putative membrane protein